MRTFLKTSALSAVIIATLFACTKDVRDVQVNIQDGSFTAAKEKVEEPSQKTDEKTEKKPLLIPDQGTGTASVGKPVTVTYTAVDATSKEPIGCGKVSIYQWDGAKWIVVAESNDPKTSYTFTPATATDCAYKFRAGFAPGGAIGCKGAYSGVEYTTESDFCVDVQECVSAFTIQHNVDAVDLKTGKFQFTITYTLISPVDISNVKFQGGATAGGKEGSSIISKGNTEVVNQNNNNTVLKWEGPLKACTPQTVTFKYERDFKCSSNAQQITGEWTASAYGMEPVSEAPLTYSCN